MADLSKGEDDTSPEEYDRRTRDRHEERRAQQEKDSEAARKDVLHQADLSGQKESQLQRIENKLDQILAILDDEK